MMFFMIVCHAVNQTLKMIQVTIWENLKLARLFILLFFIIFLLHRPTGNSEDDAKIKVHLQYFCGCQ